MSDFKELIVTEGDRIVKKTVEKNEAYGDAISATGKVLDILYPDGITPDQYPDLLLIVRSLDKICRLSKGNKRAFGESPWRDIAGYGVIGSAKDVESSFISPAIQAAAGLQENAEDHKEYGGH